MNLAKRPFSLFILLFLCQFWQISSSIAEESKAAAESDMAAIHKQREDFAHSFADIVLAIISDQKKPYEERKEILERAFSNSVDIDWIAKFVIGKSWNKANDWQREQYTSLYRKFLTKTYVENFAENPDKRISGIKILSVSENDSNKDNFTVATQMKLASQEIMRVNYLVREKEGHYKVLDIAIENVSLINTHRAEFNALAASNGIDGVITKLEQLLAGGNAEIKLSMK
jgi:phospholipid transport system substrate-binding protein